jgi:hypothetical protein
MTKSKGECSPNEEDTLNYSEQESYIHRLEKKIIELEADMKLATYKAFNRGKRWAL